MEDYESENTIKNGTVYIGQNRTRGGIGGRYSTNSIVEGSFKDGKPNGYVREITEDYVYYGFMEDGFKKGNGTMVKNVNV